MFDPRNWYWLADDGRLFSSARSLVIDEDDEQYLAWLDGGLIPTRWPADSLGDQTDATLQEVLSQYGLIVAANTLEAAKTLRISALTMQCEAEILGGYASNALGSAHTYPSKTTDQINMMGSVSASLLPGIAADWSTPFWCADSDGVWAFRMHSVSQIQTAGADGKAHVVLCQTTLEQLTTTVMAATTAEAVDAVVWPSA